jgi:serine phosphatase RsbU (regulator of sigma subunit)
MLSVPLKIIGKAMKKIKNENNYEVHLTPVSNDEFKLLFDGFNSMIHTINQQTKELQSAKREIEAIHQQTQDSIKYASLIQNSLIADQKLLQNCFKDSFALWQPKDIVGGDIYLFEELRQGDEYLLMVIDCTGHGVPGAFVTMLVKAIEQQVIATLNHNDKEINPSEILSLFNKNMKYLLKQENAQSLSNAGFDGGILYYNKKENLIKYAGAYTPLLYTKDGKLHQIKGDRYSVGYKKCTLEYRYTQHTIKVQQGMKFFLATDGYIDQNGGEKGFPFGKSRFQKILLQNLHLSMEQIQTILQEQLTLYQGDEERNDDITIVGFEV